MACAMGTLLIARHAATSTLWNASQLVMSGTCPSNSACTVRHKSSAAFVLLCRWSGPPSVKAPSPQTQDKRRLRTPRPKTAGCSSKVCTINLHISRPPWEPNGMAGAAKNGQYISPPQPTTQRHITLRTSWSVRHDMPMVTGSARTAKSDAMPIPGRRDCQSWVSSCLNTKPAICTTRAANLRSWYRCPTCAEASRMR